uniref:Uncharacterized protein n=1 Tax=Arundo donax TaxID=35708 RepID=A0A0A9HC64_ARUDO
MYHQVKFVYSIQLGGLICKTIHILKKHTN